MPGNYPINARTGEYLRALTELAELAELTELTNAAPARYMRSRRPIVLIQGPGDP
jgi:hypothetical protein